MSTRARLRAARYVGSSPMKVDPGQNPTDAVEIKALSLMFLRLLR
jgi:hypothetical protein